MKFLDKSQILPKNLKIFLDSMVLIARASSNIYSHNSFKKRKMTKIR